MKANPARRHQCQAGFSFVELLTAVAILGVLAFAGANMLAQVYKSQAEIGIKTDIDNLSLDVRMVLGGKWNCKPNVGSTPITSVGQTITLPAINYYDAAGTIVNNLITAGQRHNKLMINSIQLKTVAQLDTNTFRAVLTVDAQPPAEYMHRKSLELPMKLLLTPVTGVVSTCGDLSYEDISAKLCTDLGGTVDATGKCILTNVVNNIIANKKCPAGQVLTGFDGLGNPTCVALPASGPGPGPSPTGTPNPSGTPPPLVYTWIPTGVIVNTLAGAKATCAGQGRKVPTLTDFSNDKLIANNAGTTIQAIFGIAGQLHFLDNGCAATAGASCDFYRPAADQVGSYNNDAAGVANSGNGAYVICVQ